MRTQQQRAHHLVKLLDHFEPNPRPPLHHTSPYTLLVATLLSARCQDQRVNVATAKLFPLASTPQEMVTLPVEQIQEVIRPCGLSAFKSQSIHRLSQILLEQYEGEVPDSLELLEQLPGVGHKTASVVVVQGFGKQAFPVDTHIYRSARRWQLSRGRTVGRVETDLKALFPPQLWGQIHLQIILYARRHCPAKIPPDHLCPICTAMHADSPRPGLIDLP